MENSIIRGKYNIGGLIGLSVSTQVHDSTVHGCLSIIAISCNNPAEIFKEYYIEDLDELFDVYLKEKMKTDYQIRRHLQILKSNNFTYDDFLKLSNIDLFKFNIPQEYVLFYLCIRDKN